jgi:hypothetical protein
MQILRRTAKYDFKSSGYDGTGKSFGIGIARILLFGFDFRC